jgi:hypothetical protein
MGAPVLKLSEPHQASSEPPTPWLSFPKDAAARSTSHESAGRPTKMSAPLLPSLEETPA